MILLVRAAKGGQARQQALAGVQAAAITTDLDVTKAISGLDCDSLTNPRHTSAACIRQLACDTSRNMAYL
jgi:hypothetical protein